MSIWKSPTNEPIQIVLLSGHSTLIGPEPREVPDFFDEHLFAAGAISAGAKKRKPRKQPGEPADEPTIDGGLLIEMDDDDAL